MSESNEHSEEWLDFEAQAREAMSVLSQVSSAPGDRRAAATPFDPDDVDFADAGSWVPWLVEIQDWLNLDAELDDSSAKAAVASLTQILNVTTDATGPLDVPDAAILEALCGRLSEACRLQSQFVEDVDDEDVSLPEASRRWEAAWESLDSLEPSSGPVAATTDTWSINDFVSRVEQGNFDLNPSFQRSDVWGNPQAQLLIESVLRGIPLPSIIVIKQRGEDETKVVDGKQRLTALLRFVGAHPEAVARVQRVHEQRPDLDLPTLFREDYPRFRKAWKEATQESLTAGVEREYYFPFKLRSGQRSTLTGDQLEPLQGKFYSQIRDRKISIANTSTTVRNLFTQSMAYKIPIIEYYQATQRQIHEVFGLYNKQGVQLNAEEIRNAVYHHLDLARSILVCAGDNDDVASVAPSLEANWGTLRETAENLTDYEFGTSRFKRSKVLGWLLSQLVLDSMMNGAPRRLSTAKQITEMYQQVSDNPQHALNNTARIEELLLLATNAIRCHSAVDDAWASQFRNSKGKSRWEELQLVGSLLGVTIAAVQHGTRTEDKLADAADNLRKLTASAKFKRPPKTQTKNQWDKIALWSVTIARELGADLDACDKKIRKQFGGSGIAVLKLVADE